MRDDFSSDTIRKLGERVNLHCSNPKCRAPTKSAHETDDKAANVGKACHIHAAAAGGARYDSAQTAAERRSIHNGIWLCSNCGALIDSDPARFPASLLRAWKALAEHEAREQIGKPALIGAASGRPRVELTLDYKKTLIMGELHRYALVVVLKNIGTKRVDDWYIEVEVPGLVVQEPGTVIGTKVEARSKGTTWLFRTRVGNTANAGARRVLLAGDEYEYGFPYRMDKAIFDRNRHDNLGLFEQMAKARAFVAGELVTEAARPFGELQCF
ncbi:hypothetical protein LZC95_07955 [Pendulispora brunnea]|uniref:Uncharacterized protein n=1 Tax=Pendulispora brunnea TaxID=2905690 RepID=A0ABZ2KDQ5_9BACT